MNYKKIVLVGFISAFVALLTSFLGVTGTIIGSVISSVLYNTLSEALEKPIEQATFSRNFEWEIAYIFPLAVIAIIQLILIFALLSEWGLVPVTFLNVFLLIQDLANNNLYRVLGIALLIISLYPIVLKPDIIKKSHGAIIGIVGLIFLARGFVDVDNAVTDFYSPVFTYFDFPIAVIAFVLIVYVIINILISAKRNESEFREIKKESKENNKIARKNYRSINHGKGSEIKREVRHANKHDHINESRGKWVKQNESADGVKSQNNSHDHMNEPHSAHDAGVSDLTEEHGHIGINESSDKIHFESNDLLDDYKK